jgi:hypothetical protein
MLAGGKAARTARKRPSQIPAEWIDTETGEMSRGACVLRC